MSELRRVTGTRYPHIVCKNCAHVKSWHRDEGPCKSPGAPDLCDCEAWEYGVNVEEVDDE